jgi:hypothetical protein
MRTLKKIFRIQQREGFKQLIRSSLQYIHQNYLLQWLPKRVVRYNDVKVHAGTKFDFIFPLIQNNRSKYENTLIDGIRSQVSPGDKVVIVGGGWGVSSIIAAELSGNRGSVIVYEAGDQTVKKIHNTTELNGMSSMIDIRHAIVGEAISLRDRTSAIQISPKELPNCDVLILDCEGAEKTILDRLSINPSKIIVETHGHFGSSTQDIREILSKKGYTVSNNGIAEPSRELMCIEKDIKVLVATVNN